MILYTILSIICLLMTQILPIPDWVDWFFIITAVIGAILALIEEVKLQVRVGMLEMLLKENIKDKLF